MSYSCPTADLEKTISMLTLDDWQSLRWLHFREEKSIRWISRQFGLSRQTVKKYLQEPDAPRYKIATARARPTTGPWLAQINEIIEADKSAPRKQRHTAKRIFERLVERGYTGSERSIRQMVAEIKNKPAASASVPLLFNPGLDAQVDFGESYVDIRDERVKLHGFEMRLNYSRKKFVMFFPSTDKEAFLEGHVRAFHYYDGVVQRISYDNLSAAVGQVGKGKNRTLTKEFKELKGYYSFDVNFCTPGIEGAHEKGGVENGVGFARRNWLVPVPNFDSIDELNAYVLGKCLMDDDRTVEGQKQTIAEAFLAERPHLLPLPARPFDPGVQQFGAVDSYCTVPLKNNHYSVPPQFVGRVLTIRSYWNKVVITTGLETIAEHPRSYGQDHYILRPEHYLDLLEKRPHAVPYAMPLVQHEWPPGYWLFYQKMVERFGPSQAGKDFISILRYHVKYGADIVCSALKEANELNSANANFIIASVDRQRFKGLPSELTDLTNHQDLTNHSVVMSPEPSQYNSLM
jgi:transposase